MTGMERATRAGLIKFALLTGAADSSTAGITCAAQDGIALAVGDILIGVINLTQTTNLWVDVTATSSIIAGKLKCPESNNDVIAVWWMAATSSVGQVASPFLAAEVGAGALGATAITIAGVETSDVLVSVIEIDVTSGAWTDRTDNSEITDSDEIKCSDSTNGNSVFAMYMDLTGPRAFAAVNIQMGIATIDSSASTDPSVATLTGINAEDVVLVALVVDETDYDVIDELTSLITVSADDTLEVDEPSPFATSGSKILVFYQKSNDLDA